MMDRIFWSSMALISGGVLYEVVVAINKLQAILIRLLS